MSGPGEDGDREPWLPLEEILSDAESVDFSSEAVSFWAEPEDREENYHHRLRHAFETSIWEPVDVYGPEAELGDSERPVDILIHLRPEGEAATRVGQGELGVSEFIGIEIKTEFEKFTQRTANLKQLRDQAQSGYLDRLYACAPVRGESADLTGNPEARQRRNRERFAERQRKESTGGSTTDNQLPTSGEDTESGWTFDALQYVGILNIDAHTGEVETYREADFLPYRNQTHQPQCVVSDEISEADAQHALWQHYIQNDANVSVETAIQGTGSRPDILVASKADLPSRPNYEDLYGSTAHTHKLIIEVKGSRNADQIYGQIERYRKRCQYDCLAVGVPESEIGTVKKTLAGDFPEVGVLSVRNARSDPEVSLVRQPAPLHRHERVQDTETKLKCPDCRKEIPKTLLTKEDGYCVGKGCDWQILSANQSQEL